MKFKMFRDMINSYQTIADDCGENIDDLEVVVYLDEPSVGAISNSKVRFVSRGFDWDSNLMVLDTEDKLKRKKKRKPNVDHIKKQNLDTNRPKPKPPKPPQPRILREGELPKPPPKK